MKIVADENIPFVEHYFGHLGHLVLKPGRLITREDLLDAHILLVRSVTQVNETLLQKTSVKFVGTTTIGVDHIDIPWLDKAGIRWAAAYGCNATAVVEYVLSIVATLQKQGVLAKHSQRAGVIGVGNIGTKVVILLKKLGFEVLQCDPVRAEKEKNFISTPLENFSELDFITLHTPLTTIGPYPTYHLLKKEFLMQQKPGCVLLNSGRGAAIDFTDLKSNGKHLHWCLDVWENEPDIDLDVLNNALLATPHIAGYSVQSKYRGINMIYQAAVEQKIIDDHKIASIPFPSKIIALEESDKNWQDVVLKIFDHNQSLHEFGSGAALPIWIEFMQSALKYYPELPINQPPGIVSIRIDPLTGKRAQANDPVARFEYFMTPYIPDDDKSASASDQQESLDNNQETHPETIPDNNPNTNNNRVAPEPLEGIEVY